MGTRGFFFFFGAKCRNFFDPNLASPKSGKKNCPPSSPGGSQSESVAMPMTRVALRNDSYQLHVILPSKVDPLVSLMRVEKVPGSTYDMIGGVCAAGGEVVFIFNCFFTLCRCLTCDGAIARAWDIVLVHPLYLTACGQVHLDLDVAPLPGRGAGVRCQFFTVGLPPKRWLWGELVLVLWVQEGSICTVQFFFPLLGVLCSFGGIFLFF